MSYVCLHVRVVLEGAYALQPFALGDGAAETCYGGTVQAEIHRHVEIGSTLHTDEAGAYAGIGGMFFDHETVNHGEGEFARDGVTTNSVESVFAVLKHASPKHLGRYVDEFAFRLNEGNVKHHTLTRLESLVGAATGKRLPHADLIA